MRRVLFHSIAVVVCVASGACSDESASPDRVGACLAKCDAGDVEAPVLARCWTEGASFLCDVPMSPPLRVNTLTVRIKESADPETAAYLSSRSTAAGSERALLAELGAFPQHLQIVLDFNGRQPAEVARPLLPLEYPLTLMSAAQYTADKPLELKLPFRLRTVELLNPHALDAIVTTESRGLDLRPMVVRDGGATSQLDLQYPFVIAAKPRAQVVMLAVDEGVGRVGLDVVIGDAFFDRVTPITYQATIEKSGRYVLGDTGLRFPTAEEAALFGDARSRPTDPVVPAARAAPCANACTETQVCVAGTCRWLADQVEWKDATCDLGDDSDCAPGHTCGPAGKCVR